VTTVTHTDETAPTGHIVLGQNNYGNSEVRIVNVLKGRDHHDIWDLWVDVALEGDFAANHLARDNTGLLVTDTTRLPPAPRSFADRHSPSVQATLYPTGEEVLKAHPEVSRIHFSLPNKHHLLDSLGRFGIENDNETFHASSEPYGLFEGVEERAV
jgi:urate oxidase